MRLLLAFSLLAGCAPTPELTSNEAAVTRELAGRVAGPEQRCVEQTGSNLRVIDRHTLAYEAGDRLWVNRLRPTCPGFEPNEILIVDLDAGFYCRNNRVRATRPGQSVAGAACLLNAWTPYRRPG